MNEYDLCQHGAAPGESQDLLRLPGNMHDITLSPDGKRLAEYAYIKNQEQMRVFDLDTRQTTLIPEESSRPITGFAFSKDGNFLALLKAGGAMVALGPDQSIRGSSQISLYSFSTGQDRLVFDSGEPGNISWSGWAR
jgi:WD40 repeat protein